MTLDLAELTRHAAFLGAPGSGKTTIGVLNLVEHLLCCAGSPAILVDRKGRPLRATPGQSSGMLPAISDPDLAGRGRTRLHAGVDVSGLHARQPTGPPAVDHDRPAPALVSSAPSPRSVAAYAATGLAGNDELWHQSERLQARQAILAAAGSNCSRNRARRYRGPRAADRLRR